MRERADKQRRVRKSNSLNQAKFRLNPNEYRLLMFCATQIKPMTADVPNEFRIYGKEYAETFGISEANAYKQIREGLDATWEASFYEWLPSGRNKEPGWIRKRFVITQQYHPSEGYGSLTLHPDFLQHLVDLREQYTDYEVRNLQSMRSFNAMRMYDLLIQFRTIGRRDFDLEWFKQVMGLEDSYPRWTDIRKHVLLPSLRQIEKQTDVDVIKNDKGELFSAYKRGGKVQGFTIEFRHKAQQTLDLDDPEQPEPVELVDEHDWQRQGYATEGEYREALALQQRFGVTFTGAKDYLRYRARLDRLKSEEC